MYLLQKVALKVNKVVGLDDVGAALTAEHPCKQRLHGWWALPCGDHGVGYLEQQMNTILESKSICFKLLHIAENIGLPSAIWCNFQ